MHLQDIERFVAIPYDADAFDCADLVVEVQQTLFGRDVSMPSRRPRGPRGATELKSLSTPYARRREGTPIDGDLVLMFDHGQRSPGHAGVFFFLAHEEWVLHTSEGTTCSVLHRIRDLPGFGLRVEGIYEWA